MRDSQLWTNTEKTIIMIKAREFCYNDIPIKVDWINNPEINNSMFFELPATISKTEEWFKNKNNTARIDFSFINEQEIIVGMGGFTDIDRKNLNAEFYVMVNPSMHSQGIGKIISLWMYNYAFLELNLNKLYLFTNDDNIAASKIYENAGFKLEGVLRQHKSKNGVFLDRHFYGLLRKEWKLQKWCKKELTYELD